MPKNLKGGNKAKKQGNKNINNRPKDTVVPDVLQNQHVGKVIKLLGDCRFMVKILSNNGLKDEEIISWLSAGKKRYGRIMIDSIILVSKRDFENKCDILYLYNQGDVDYLLNKKIIETVSEKREEEDDVLFEFNESAETDINIDNI